MSRNFAAVIPARSGSSLTHKNIRKISGRTLIEIAYAAANSVGAIKQIVLSSDSHEYLKLLNGEKLISHIRPDWASSSSASAQDVLDSINFSPDIDAVVYLQPTSPLRKASHISEAIELFLQNPKCEVVGITEIAQHPSKVLRILENGTLKEAYSPEGFSNSNRQSLPRLWYPNGALYIIPRTDSGFQFGANSRIGFPMSKISSLDIDSEDDFRIAEALIAHEP